MASGDERGASAKTEVEIPECRVHSVVVYPDRAEVTRLVKVELGVGECEVVLKSLSKALDKESIRVDGIGPASITEVSYQEVPVTVEEDQAATASAEVVELEQRLSDLVSHVKTVEQRLARLTAQSALLRDFSSNLMSAGEHSGTATLTDRQTVDGMFGFLETYEKQSVDLKVSEFEASEEKKELETKLQEVRQRLADLKPKLSQPEEPVKQPVIGVLLNVREEGEIQLLVSYLVSNASWRPKYDLRVSSKECTMEVGYFGMVQQNTGEDWLEARLSLSTATPSIGGSAPKLETARLNLIPNAVPRSRGRSSSMRGRHAYGYGEDGKSIEATPAQVTEGLSSSVFDIATATTVPSDNTTHKVAIATIPLKPNFEYDTVPKQVEHAFLRAKVINNSRYPFLEGVANVYLDQSYVAETRLTSVAPQEEFSCSLGVDQSVRVVYKPLKRFREQSGLLSRSVTYTYRQVTEVTNTRSEPAILSFTDQLPRSEDEKLKVTLVAPVLAKQKVGDPPPNPHLNSAHNLVWRLELNAGESRSLLVHYTVEFPAGKRVEGLGLTS